MTPNLCGCRQCGGPQYRADSIIARGIVAHGRFIAYRRGQSAYELAHRHRLPTDKTPATEAGPPTVDDLHKMGPVRAYHRGRADALREAAEWVGAMTAVSIAFAVGLIILARPYLPGGLPL